MSLRSAIHSCLKAASGVTALIGSGDAARHFPIRADQPLVLPCVVSQQVAGDAKDTHGGTAEDTLEEALVQFSCLAATAAGAIALRKAVRTALIGDTGGFLAAGGIRVTGAATRELVDDATDTTNAQLDLTFFHNPST